MQRDERCGGTPCGKDELGDAVGPLFVDVVDWAVAQELVCRNERSSSLHGRAGRVGRRTSWGERGCGSAAVPPHGWMLGRCLLLVPRRAGGGVGGRRRGVMRATAHGRRLGDAGGESSPTLGVSSTSVSHGHDGRSHTNSGRNIPAHPYLARQMSDFGFR